MFKDRIALGIVAGLVGNLVKNSVDRLLGRFKKSDIKYRNIAAGIFVGKRSVHSKEGRTLGLLADYGLAAVYGIPLVYTLSFSGKDRYPLKGLLFGLLTWGVGLGLTKNFTASRVYPDKPRTNMIMGLSHGAGGLAAAWTAVKLGDESLFNPGPLNLEEKTAPSEQQPWARVGGRRRQGRRVSSY